MTESAGLAHDLREEVEKCVNCGFCESVCPTLPASGFRPIIGARGRVNLAKFFLDETEKNGKSSLPIADAFYSCLDCYACVQVCPAGINAGRVSDLGKRIIAGGQLTTYSQEKPVAKMIVESTKRFRNPLGVRKECARWAKGIKFDRGSDILLYTGNMYQLMAFNASMSGLVKTLGESMSNLTAKVVAHWPSLLRLSRFAVDGKLEEEMGSYLKGICTMLDSAGVQFNYMGEEEPYPGTLLYDLGYLNEFVEYGASVAGLFRERGVNTIIAVDPHTYDVLRNKYPKYIRNFDFKVVYYLDYLKDLEFEKDTDPITFHEPCYFVLRDDSYSSIPRLLSKVTRVEYPQRSGKRTMCCGGPAEALFGGLAERISGQRLSQLKSARGKKIITACPICYANLRKDESVEDISGFLAGRFRNRAS